MKDLQWDEMVFKNRNRSYGAYVIRKEYPSALIASVVFMLVVMLLLFAMSPFALKILKSIARGGRTEKKIIYVVKPPKDLAAGRSAAPATPLKKAH